MSTSGNNSKSNACEAIKKRKGFHGKYLEICKSRNIQPLGEIKSKKKNSINTLDFHADRVKVDDWFAICKALKMDKTLKFLAIRLRKNDGNVLEEINTLKKAREVTAHPVIYSKFIFTALMDSLQSMLRVNDSIETLILEGLPITAEYMETLSSGLSANHSINTLSFTRSNIGDDACSILCTNIKHLSNIETLNFNNCNLTTVAADAVKDFIKSQKIQRFSDAWINSLRYQNIEYISLNGLRKIVLNNNPLIGDSGLEVLKTELIEDVWIKEIEMENCGLTEIGAQYVIEILNENKTMTMFSVANNLDMPEQLHRQIMLQSNFSINLDSNDMREMQDKITKSQMIDRLKFLEDRLELEISRQEQMKDMNDQLTRQLCESQQELDEIHALIPSEGFVVIKNDELKKLLNNIKPLPEKKAPQVVRKLRQRKRRSGIPIRVKSLMTQSSSQSHTIIESTAAAASAKSDEKKPFIEQNIGDYFHNEENEIENIEP